MTVHIGILANLPPKTRTVVLIGSRTSDHLRELIRIAEFKGRAAYRIETASELQPRWFAGQEEIGIVLGAAELEPVVKAVLNRLNELDAMRPQVPMPKGPMPTSMKQARQSMKGR